MTEPTLNEARPGQHARHTFRPPPERGGFDERLLAELIEGRAPDVMLRAEGFTDDEATRVKVASSLRSTSDAVSMGPVTPCEP